MVPIFYALGNPSSKSLFTKDAVYRVGGSYNSGASSVPPSEFVSSFAKVGFNPNANINFNLNIGGNGNGRGGNNGNDNGGSSGSNGGKGNSRGKSGSRPSASVKGDFRPKDFGVTKLTFSSGHNSGILTNAQENNNFDYSSCFIMCGECLPHFRTGLAESLMARNAYFKYSNAACSKINTRVLNKNQMNEDSFFKYFQALSSGLQMYYMLKSIIAYTSNPSNRNPGLMSIRRSIDAELLSGLGHLEICLLENPIPSNLLDYIRYMYSNFTFSEASNSPIIRLGFRGTLVSSSRYEYLNRAYVETLVSEIRDCQTVSCIIAKTFDNMVRGTLPPVSDVAIYDPGFLTFWTNSCVSYFDWKKMKVSFTRFVENDQQNFDYFTFNEGDNLDALFYASLSVKDLNTGTLEPGLWTPISNETYYKSTLPEQSSSLLHYVSSSDSFFVPQKSKICSQSGVFHSVYYYPESVSKFVGHESIPVACKKVQLTSIANTYNAVTHSIDWLFETS